MNNKSTLFSRIAETPKAAQLASAVRQGYRRYPTEDCLDDLCSLALELINGGSVNQAMVEHPLAVCVIDKQAAVKEHSERYGAGLRLVDDSRSTVTIDLGSLRLAARV